MITFTKKSKTDKIDTKFFTIVKISMEREEENETTLPYLLPPSSLLIKRRQGDLGKAKFIKKYKKYLKKNKGAEFAVFNILKALKNNSSIVFTATDDEYKLGYLQAFVEYLNEEFGIETLEFKEANETLKSELSSLDKKQKKLIKKDDEEIDSEKKIKAKNKIIKNIKKLIKSDFSEEGNDKYNTLDKKFAVDQIMWASIDSGVCEFKKNTISNIDESKINKTKPYVTAIFLTADNDKKYKNIINEVLNANGLKFKAKALRDLNKSQIISLCGEIYKKIVEYRDEDTYED